MNLIARMACQPIAHPGHVVSAVVIHDQMYVEPGGKIEFDVIEKPKELLMPVAAIATAPAS
jgi:hypothetical protein